MKFEQLLREVDDIPVFKTGFLLVGPRQPDYIRQQLTRWSQQGKLYQIERGLYSIAPPYQKIKPHEFLVANAISTSYVSLQSALSYYSLIPEYVPVTTSIGPERRRHVSTPLGRYYFRHCAVRYFWGYDYLEVAPTQFAFIATPEKALLDLLYLTPDSDKPAYLRELRLQNTEILNWERMEKYLERWNKPKLRRALPTLRAIAQEEAEDYETA